MIVQSDTVSGCEDLSSEEVRENEDMVHWTLDNGH